MPLIGARAHDFSGKDPEELFSAISGAGYEAIQLACPKSFSWAYPLDEKQTEQILAAKEKHHITLSVLGCYVSCADQDRESRLQAVETFRRGIRTAKALGAGCVGTETCHFEGTEKEHEKAFELLVDSCLRMAEEAEKYDVDMGIEPVFQNTLDSPELALELRRRVGSRHLRFIWDAVNLLDSALDRDEAAFQKHCADLMGDNIVAMHIKGVRFKADRMKRACPLIEGEYDWRYPFQWAKEQKNMALLREEAIPARAEEEIRIMRGLLNER